MKALYKIDEAELGQMPMSVTVTMKRCEWAQVRDDLSRALNAQFHIHTSRFIDIVRGILEAHARATQGHYEIDEQKRTHFPDGTPRGPLGDC